MAYAILIIFFITCLIAFLEHRFPKKYNIAMYIFIGIILAIMAGMREIGIDPDSENYETSYQQYYNLDIMDGIEYSFILLSSILNNITNDVHAIFLVYAFLGVFLKLAAFRQLSEFYFLPLIVYMSFYYEVHELTQIRTGVLSGILLLSIRPIAERKYINTLLLVCIGTFFHFSGLILLPLMMLSNKKITDKWRIVWVSIIPLAYVIYSVGGTLLMNANLPIIGNKLAMYQMSEEKGTSFIGVNVFGPLHILNILLYFYMIFFSNTITEHNKYFPLMIKIFGLGLFAYITLAFLPVLSQRISLLLKIVSIILFYNIYYTIKPKWASILFVLLISFLYLNYGLKYIDFQLLWEV